MRIKEKISFSIGALGILILVLITLSLVYCNMLVNHTRKTLNDDNNTFIYLHSMYVDIESGLSIPANQEDFQNALTKEIASLSNAKELNLVGNIEKSYNIFLSDVNNDSLKNNLHHSIDELADFSFNNMEKSVTYIMRISNIGIDFFIIIGFLSIITSVLIYLWLSKGIIDPINDFVHAAHNIANKDYSKRIELEEESEFSVLADEFNNMAEEIKEYNASSLYRVMRSKKRIEALINHMEDPVMGLDASKKIIYVNTEMIKILGMNTEEQVLNKRSEELAVANDLIRNLIKEIVIGESVPTQYSALKVYFNGKESFFEKEIIEIIVDPIGEETESVAGYFIILKNVTRFKNLDAAKTNFILNVSLKLKAIISSIRVNLEILESEQTIPMGEVETKLLNGIKTDSNKLFKITAELLNITQVDSGKTTMSIVPANIRDIVNVCLKDTQKQAEQRMVVVKVICPDSVPNVFVDIDKTTWVLTNLISNAIRYSYEHATVFLRVLVMQSLVRIEVQDVGQGMNKELKSRVFERYLHLSGMSKEGSGLALSVSKEFIEQQGGQMFVESELGAGSTFAFTMKINN